MITAPSDQPDLPRLATITDLERLCGDKTKYIRRLWTLRKISPMFLTLTGLPLFSPDQELEVRRLLRAPRQKTGRPRDSRKTKG